MISMAINYIVIPEKKMVIAELKNTKFDAYNKALKLCKDLTDCCKKVYVCPDPDKMMMPNEFKGVAICRDGDVFDEEVGKSIAKSSCLNKYYRSFDKRINKFKDDLNVVGARAVIMTNHIGEDDLD